MSRSRSALLEAARMQIAEKSVREEMDAALAPVQEEAEVRPPAPVLVPSLPEPDNEADAPAEDSAQDSPVETPAAVPQEEVAGESANAAGDIPAAPEVADAAPAKQPVKTARRPRPKARTSITQMDEVLSSIHVRFPRGMTSWSANLRVPPELVRELDDWKWRLYKAHQREALNTRIFSVALERLSPADLVERAEELRSVDPATNIPWAVRIPATMRPLIVEFTRATNPPLDKSQVGVVALTKFLDDFAALAPQQA